MFIRAAVFSSFDGGMAGKGKLHDFWQPTMFVLIAKLFRYNRQQKKWQRVLQRTRHTRGTRYAI